jgi:MinD superfamily P-loop ATPase
VGFNIMNNRPYQIVVASGKGGVGKSMLASGLAMLLAKKYDLVAVDCDVDAPNLAIWLNAVNDKILKSEKISTSQKPIVDLKRCNNCGLCVKNCEFAAMSMVNRRPELNSFLCEGCGVCQVVCPQNAISLKPVKNGKILVRETKYGFRLVSGQLFPGETGSGKVVSEVKKEALRYRNELMIIDSSPGTGCPVNAALQGADLTILVTEPTLSGWSDLKRVLPVVKYFKLPYRIVINKWDLNKQLSGRLKRWAGRDFVGQVSYDQEIFKAISQLKPVMETKLRARKEIREIFKELVKEIDL